MDNLGVHYVPTLNRARFTREPGAAPDIWSRIVAFVQSGSSGARISGELIELPWSAALDTLREFDRFQRQLEFRFVPTAEANERIEAFVRDYRATRLVVAAEVISPEAIAPRLAACGWDAAKRTLKDHQVAGLVKLVGWHHGANFSVPGAGKTTVTFALHLIAQASVPYLLVVAPRNAFLAWQEVIGECLRDDVASQAEQTFTILQADSDLGKLVRDGNARFLVSYEMMVRLEPAIASFLAQHPTHLVVDESHRMKAGYRSQRGSSLLRLSHLARRRDILSGTPMPQAPSDVQSQLDFLFPGAGLGDRIERGESARIVLGERYVRTTKRDLDLPPRVQSFIDVDMNPAHLALYSIVKDELRRRVSQLRRNASEILQARRSVIRLLQISANPASALRAMAGTHHSREQRALYAAVMAEGASAKVLRAEQMAREFARGDRKTLIWTIFTDTVEELSRRLADLNPVTIRGGVPTGDVEDYDSREGRIERFRHDPNCRVMVANPAAASEGMSLHMQCHDAIYVDRSFNATHFLQSIDRIHRLGLPPGVETRIHVIRNRVPVGIGSIDRTVGRRLLAKIRALDDLLNDPDLRQLALDEEAAGDGVDYGIDVDDIDDLIREIESPGDGDDDELI
jgi:SNF2 family DNA or RNA helicase